MTFFVNRFAIPMMLIALLLTACSGGESGTGLAGSQKMVSVGAITGFGSVFVNGVEYDTSGANIYVNDSPATEQDLSIGMVVAVVESSRAANAAGEAGAIYYNDEVYGIVTGNDQAGTLDIMGQSVNYDAETLFDSSVDTIQAIIDIPVGAVVQVSGYRAGGNSLLATHLVLVATSYSLGGLVTVKGVIDTVNANTFTLGNLTVVMDTSTQLAGNIPNQLLTAGMSVKVESRRGMLNGELQADKIQLFKHGYARNGALVEVEGIITNLNAQAGKFMLNGYTVFYSGHAVLRGNGNSLEEGMKAEVVGVLISDNQIDATEVNTRFKSNTDLIARVNSVDTANNRIAVLGADIQISNRTLMKDSDLHIKKFSLADVNPGDKIEIKAYKANTSGIFSTSQFIRLQANSPDSVVELQGILEQYSATKIVVSGITVDIASLTSAPPISAADVGRKLTVKGTALDNATEITASDIVF